MKENKLKYFSKSELELINLKLKGNVVKMSIEGAFISLDGQELVFIISNIYKTNFSKKIKDEFIYTLFVYDMTQNQKRNHFMTKKMLFDLYHFATYPIDKTKIYDFFGIRYDIL